MKTYLTTAMFGIASTSAAAGVVNVLPGDPSWVSFGNSGGGSTAIEATTVIDGDGSLRVRGDRTRFGTFSDIDFTDGVDSFGLLSDVTALSFQWSVTSEGAGVVTAQAPALRLNVFDPGSGRTHEIIWEDGEQAAPDRQFVAGTGSLNTAYTGDFFGTDASRVYAITSPFSTFGRGLYDGGGTLIAGSNAAQDFSAIVNDYNLSANSVVFGVTIGVGSSVGDFDGYADTVRLAFGSGFDTTWNFAVPAPGAAALFGLSALAAVRRRR